MEDLKRSWESCPEEDNKPKIINGKIVFSPMVTIIDSDELKEN